MSNVIMCRGEYSKTPFYLKSECKNIYCIEELCYYLFHNAYLLGDDFVSYELADWISDQLDLKDLGREINKICRKNDALIRLIGLLADQIGFYSDEEWHALLDDIGKNGNLSAYEKRKKRADGFLSAGKLGLALDEYDQILKDAPASDVKFKAKIYHNMGVCAAKLFMFKNAAGYFEKAYASYANTESYVSMLCAMKMYMSPSDYLDYLSAHKESYEDSLEVERRFESLKGGFDAQTVSRYIAGLKSGKDKGGEYYSGIESLTEEVKEEYRSQIFRGRTGGY